jgi:hypothetical protein
VKVDAFTVVGSSAREKIAETEVSLGAAVPGAVETTVGGGLLRAAVVKFQETGATSATPSIAVIVEASRAV